MPLASLSSCLWLIEVYTPLSPSQPYKNREDNTQQVEHASLSLSLSLSGSLCVSHSHRSSSLVSLQKDPKMSYKLQPFKKKVTTLQRAKGNNVIIALITTQQKCVYQKRCIYQTNIFSTYISLFKPPFALFIQTSRYHINFPIMWILNERTILIDVKTERLQQKYKVPIS